MAKNRINNITQLFFELLPVQIITSVISYLSTIISGVVIGKNLTAVDMVALGFASPLTMIIAVIGSIIPSGAKVICGRYIGRGEKDKVNETFTTSLVMLLVYGLLISVICQAFIYKIAIALGCDNECINNTVSYLRGISIGIIPSVITPCLITFLQMQNESRYALFSTLTLAIVNFILDFGCCMLFDVNIFSIGLISSISQYIYLAILVVKFIKDKKLAKLEFRHNLELIKNIVVIGLPSGLSGVLYSIRNTSLNLMAGNIYGNDAVNALSILNSSCGIFDSVNIGVSTVALMLCSVYYGERDKKSIKDLFYVCIKWGLLFAFIKLGIIYFGSYAIGNIYNASEEVNRLLFDLYVPYGITMPLNIFTVVFVAIFQSTDRVTLCSFLYPISAFIAPIGFAKLLAPVIGIHAVFNCYWFAEIAAIFTIYIVTVIKKKKLFVSLEELLGIDSKMNIGNHLSISIKDISHAINVSKEIEEYCKKENIDERRSMLTGLCAEEICVNIFEHGFTKVKRKSKNIDLFVDVEDNLVNLRIKDNAISFDPHIKINESEDKTVNIGIRMVSKIAQEMKYQNTFGLNVLSITL